MTHNSVARRSAVFRQLYECFDVLIIKSVHAVDPFEKVCTVSCTLPSQ